MATLGDGSSGGSGVVAQVVVVGVATFLSYPERTMVGVEATAIRFAAAARVLGLAAHRHGLVAPGFRSPPRLADADRTLKRRPDGWAVVAVRFRGRLWPAVVADMIDGVVAANALRGTDADQARTVLWAAVESASLMPVMPAAELPRRTLPSASRGQAGRVARRPSLHAVATAVDDGARRGPGHRSAA